MAKLSLRARYLRILSQEYGGERKRSILVALANGDVKLFNKTITPLINAGLVGIRRCNGGQRYFLTT